MIHWLLQSAAEYPEIVHGAAPAGLLSAAELERMEQLPSPKRQREWVLGRCAAKRLAQRYLADETGQQPPLDALVIARESDDSAAPIVVFDGQATPLDLPGGARWVSGAPLVAVPGRRRGLPVPRVSGMRLPISLSISHSQEMVLCALYAVGGRWHSRRLAYSATAGMPLASSGARISRSPDQPTAQSASLNWQDQVVDTGFPAGGLVQVGVDVEGIDLRADAFMQAYFAADEIHWLGQALDDEQALLATVTWSAKEAVLKALHLGLTVDTRRVICLPATGLELAAGAEHGWNEVYVQCDPALLPGALRLAGQPARNRDWTMRGWWRREGRFVLTLAALWQEAVV